MIVWNFLIIFTLIMIFIDFYKLKNNLKVTFLIIYTGIIVFLKGFRFKIGWDYDSYVKILNNQGLKKYVNHEKIFEYIYYFLEKLNLNDQMLFFLTSFISIFLLSRFIKRNSEYFYMSFLIFILDIRFFMGFNSTIRQGLAMVFFLLGVESILNSRKIKSIIYFCLGLLSHKSIIICIPLLFFMRIKIKNYYIIFSPVFGVLIQKVLKFLIQNYFDDRYLYYLNSSSGIAHYKIIIFNTVMSFILVVLVEKKLKYLQQKKIEYFLKLYKIGMIFYLAITPLSIVFSRISDYLTILNIILIPFLIEKKEINKYKKNIFNNLFVFFYISFLTIFLYKNIITKQRHSDISADNYNYKLNIKIFKNLGVEND